MLVLYNAYIYLGEFYDNFLYKYESHCGKKKREFCREGNVAATIGFKLSDVTFLDNQLMYHSDSNKISKSKIGPFPFEL
jgi:hypothetical protein